MNPQRTTQDWKAYLHEILDKSQFIALSTYGAGGLWVCPVYFAYDQDFTLYFLSELHSRHVQNIAANPTVAGAVFDTNQAPRGKVRGLQLVGTSKLVRPEQAEHATRVYFTATPARTPIDKKQTPRANQDGSGAWQLSEIRPTKIYCFDELHFGSTRIEIPPDVLTP
ncbi:MAG: pyridoxamine 5'-phosphate oxidase family protein [bacterium]|nr:pyridoxamine 5'-phosphate oxidase family protein [bacterium]